MHGLYSHASLNMSPTAWSICHQARQTDPPYIPHKRRTQGPTGGAHGPIWGSMYHMGDQEETQRRARGPRGEAPPSPALISSPQGGHGGITITKVPALGSPCCVIICINIANAMWFQFHIELTFIMYQIKKCIKLLQISNLSRWEVRPCVKFNRCTFIYIIYIYTFIEPCSGLNTIGFELSTDESSVMMCLSKHKYQRHVRTVCQESLCVSYLAIICSATNHYHLTIICRTTNHYYLAIICRDKWSWASFAITISSSSRSPSTRQTEAPFRRGAAREKNPVVTQTYETALMLWTAHDTVLP